MKKQKIRKDITFTELQLNDLSTLLCFIATENNAQIKKWGIQTHNSAEQNKYKWDLLIWTKPNPIPAFFGHYMIDKEYCVYMKEPGAPFNSKLGYQKYFTYFNYPIGTKTTKHPTEKPLNFIKKMIEVSSYEGNLILDPYTGSGTTCVAAKELKRNYIGIEINPEYVKIANDRLSQEYLFS